MGTMLKKEMSLTANILSYIFIAFSLMAFIPGYPILVGNFFICMGIFYTFQSAREANDTLYTAMLPVKKSDVVKAKYIFTIFIEICSFILITVFTIIRMTALSADSTYTTNVLMNANVAYLGYTLICFGIYNVTFLPIFFKTAYKIGVPFLVFSIIEFVIIGIGETLHHLPGLSALNATTYSCIQTYALIAGIVFYIAGTLLSLKVSIKRFNVIDL